jgi:hypothetical protein
LNYVLDVNTGGDELRALLRHGPQEPLAILINERDVI